MKEDPKDKALRAHVVYLLADGGAHAKFDEVIAGIPPKLRERSPTAFPFALDAAGTHANSTMGHSGIQPKCEPRLPEMAGRILAENGSSAQPCSLECKYQEVPPGLEGDAGSGKKSKTNLFARIAWATARRFCAKPCW